MPAFAACTTGGTGDCEVGSGKTYATVQACSTAMAAGQTCRVFAGTYAENVTISSGSAGSYKTLTANGSDVVWVTSFSAASHDKINGFHIGDASTATGHSCVAFSASSTDSYVTGNTITNCGAADMILLCPVGNQTCSFLFFQNNTLSYACMSASSPTGGCDAIAAGGSNLLIEGNDFSHYRLGINFSNASHSVFRNNTFHDQFESEAGGSSNHTDAIFAEPAVVTPVQYNMAEGNHQWNAVGPNAKGMLVQADGCGGTGGSCFNFIVRYNTVNRIGSGNITSDLSWPNVRVYSNTWADGFSDTGRSASSPGEEDHFANGSTGTDINNIFYFSSAVVGANLTACDDSPSCTALVYGNNLGFCAASGAANCKLFSHLYATGTFASDPGNLYGRTDTVPTNDPAFVNFVSASGSADLHLTAGSPAIGAGRNLTTANGSASSSTTLVVGDASYFQDGYGMSAYSATVNVQPDWLRVGASTVVQIAAGGINYTTNTITLASAATWSNADPIYLEKKSDGVQVLFGAAPDMGAFPFTASTTGGSAISGNSVVSGNSVQ